MRIVFVSDTHNRHGDVDLPPGDLLVHCGDATVWGTDAELLAFGEWLGRAAQRYEHGAVFVPGNHDLLFRDEPARARQTVEGPKIRVETHGAAAIGGARFFFSSWSPRYRGRRWAFHYERGQGAALWGQVPEDTEVLVTHGPPLFVLDGTVDRDGVEQSAGCPDLLWRAVELNQFHSLRLHAFGHIHAGHGVKTLSHQDAAAGPMMFVNAAILDDSYGQAFEPEVVVLPSRP